MSQPDKKLEKFTSAVLKDANEQRSGVLQEIEAYRKTALQKAEEEILHESYIMIQNEIAAIKNKHSREISLEELNRRRNLLKLREEITASVFEDAKKRILEFTKTPAYLDYMCDIVKKSALEIPEGETSIIVKQDDLPLADALLSAYGKPAKVSVGTDISVGGVIIFNHDKGVVIDKTLDIKLNDQKDWFAASSGLTLG
jgi:V/A-type H+-transporting ATPase subunit E